MFADFHSKDIRPHCSEWLNKLHRLVAICWAHSFNILDGKPSGQLALDISRQAAYTYCDVG